jgi:hypothetical protein
MPLRTFDFDAGRGNHRIGARRRRPAKPGTRPGTNAARRRRRAMPEETQ